MGATDIGDRTHPGLVMVPPPPPADGAIDSDGDSLEFATDHGDNSEPRINVPMPPAGTSNFGYEQAVAIWRARLTDLVYATRREMVGYRHEEQQRHAETMAAIKGRGAGFVAFWRFCTTLLSGALDLAKLVVERGFADGNAKWLALILIALAGIVQGVAVSGLGFSVGAEAPEVIDDDGASVLIRDEMPTVDSATPDP